ALWLRLGTPIREQTNWSQKPCRYGLHFVHILSLETLAITQIEQTIIGQTAARHVINGEIGNQNPYLVFSRMQKASHVEGIRRAPDRPGSALVDIDHGRFSHRPLKPRLHARS